MRALLILCLSLLVLPRPGLAYPLDGEAYTGIARLEGYRQAQAGQVRGPGQPLGGRLALEQVDLRLVGSGQAVPPPDPQFSRQLAGLLGDEADRYSLAVLDLSDPARPLYAEHRAHVRFNPGSVGKLVVATALFQILADLYPDNIAARERVLRQARVVADGFIVHDSHVVPFWDGRRLSYRPLRRGDAASLWTYLDWMMSASSNAAASMVMREMLLLAHFGRDYPVAQAQIDGFFRDTSKVALGRFMEETLRGGIERNGLDPKSLRQGGFFTRAGKIRVPGGGSWATPRELVRWLLALEQGHIVDAWSSREIKRLLYMTQRRIRYASSHAIRDAAVYFKSGSLYRCRPEPDFVCRKYQGNVENLLNSVAIIEHPAGERRLHYMVVVSSNVLRKNSAVAHQTLGTRLQRLLEKRHAAKPLISGGQNLGRRVEYGLIHLDDQAAQPVAPLGVFRQGHGDVAAAVALDDGAVGMPVPPGTGLAIDMGTRTLGFQALDELVVDAGIAQEALHLSGQFRGNETAGFQHVVKAGHLEGSGAVGKIVQGVAQGLATLAVGPAHPQAAVTLGVVEAIAGGLQQIGQVTHPHAVQHLAGGAVGGNADHAGEGIAGVPVQFHLAGLDAGKGAQQDGDLGKAGGIDHVVGIEGREAGPLRMGDVDQGHGEMTRAYRAIEAQGVHFPHELGLQGIIEGLVQRRIGLAGEGECGTQGQSKAEEQSYRVQTSGPPGLGLAGSGLMPRDSIPHEGTIPPCFHGANA